MDILGSVDVELLLAAISCIGGAVAGLYFLLRPGDRALTASYPESYPEQELYRQALKRRIIGGVLIWSGLMLGAITWLTRQHYPLAVVILTGVYLASLIALAVYFNKGRRFRN